MLYKFNFSRKNAVQLKIAAETLKTACYGTSNPCYNQPAVLKGKIALAYKSKGTLTIPLADMAGLVCKFCILEYKLFSSVRTYTSIKSKKHLMSFEC
jgi:hypothetical protein